MDLPRPLETLARISRRARALLLVLAMLGAAGHPVDGQGLRFRHLRSEDGLPGPWVESIAQDHRGFMWFGTATGLSRYDGYRMETYRSERGDPHALPNNEVFVLREDRQGVLWVGTGVGLARYERSNNWFTTFPIRVAGSGADRRVNALLEDVRGTFWVGTQTGLFHFDRATGASTPVPLAGLKAASARIEALYEDRRGHVLVATREDGLYDYDPATRTMRHFAHARPGTIEIPSDRAQSIVEDPQGRLWVGTYDSGLMLLDIESGRTTVYRHDPLDPSSPTTDHLRTMIVDRAGWLWIATENGGLEHFDPATRRFTHVRSDPSNPFGVSSESIWSLFLDPTGTLWAGTFTGGVDVLRPASEAIQRFATIGRDTLTLSSNSVTGFAQDSTGMIWIATDGGGINRLDPATGRFRRYHLRSNSVNRNSMLSASVDARGKVWVGTWEEGLLELDPATGAYTQYTSRNTNSFDDHIFSVHVDRKGRIWAGTWEQGLMRFDPATKSFTQFHYSADRPESQIWIIRELHDGRLALGTLSGFVVFDPETGASTTYSVDSTAHSLGGFDVRAILEEKPGIVWIGTSTGLDRLDLAANTTRHYSVKDGLPSNMIAGLALDRERKLWVSSDRGVARWDPASGSAWSYTPEDGLQAREFTARTYLTGRDGMLLFGGNDGFNLIRPELLERNTREPRVAFTGFQLFNKPVAIGAPGSPLTTHISEAKEIRLDHTQSVFTIEFAALDYTAPMKNQYAYKLEGFDKDWTQAGSLRSATYTNLPPETYVFRVRASNNDGVWNETGASIRIVVSPPFWATWWFRALVVLAVAAAIAAIIRSAQLRHRTLEAMNEQLGRAAEHDRESQQYLEGNVLDILGAMQKFSGGDYSVALAVESEDAIGKLRLGFNSVVADRKRAEEELRQSQKMEAVGRLAGGVAHDFNNLLTVIKGNAGLALADLSSKPSLMEEVEIREEIEEVERAAERASSLTRQLLAFSRKQILKPQTLSLNDMIAEIGRMLRRTVGEDIELKIVLDPALGHVRADPGQIEQVVLNLVVNARDAMPRGGELVIETRNVSAASVRDIAEAENIEYVAIVVTDNGTGMAAGIRDRVFEPFFTTKEQGKGTGLGLSTVYGSVKQSGGFVVVESELGAGSRFSVYLPRARELDETRITGEVEAAPRGSATVLLVEDEEAVRRLASRVLSRAGYTVLTASCGEAAIEVAALFAGTIDLLMTDVVMPGMSGRVLAEQLMPRHPGMRLLYASGYTEDAIIRHGVSSQETAFLEKPFTPNGLLRKVQAVLDLSPAEPVPALASIVQGV